MSAIIRLPGLYPLRSKPHPHKLFGFDIETYNHNKDFLLGSIYGADGYQFQVRTREEMMVELTKGKRFNNAWIFATNLTFDLGALIGSSRKMLEHFEIMMRGSNFIFATTYILHNKNDGKFYHPSTIKMISKERRAGFDKLTFVDTLSHFKASVDELGKIVGISKLDTPEFIGEMPKGREQWKQMYEYNMRDSEVTYKFASWLQAMYNDLGATMKFTAPSTAMDLFRRHYLGAPWFTPERENILASYKPYYGGRTEAFKRGHFLFENFGKTFVYDVNSLYPYVMREFQYPVPSKYFTTDRPTAGQLDGNAGFANFTLRAPADMYIPILPVKADKLIFPTGIIKGWYDFDSVRFAVDRGYEIISAKDATVYTDRFRPFKSYVDELYRKRNEYKAQGSKVEAICKLLLNSLYGKWGQRFNNKESLILYEHIMPDMIDKYDMTIYDLDDEVWKMTTNDESRIPSYVNPILASYVTAYARLHLYKLFDRVGHDRIMYCDTDSVFTQRHLAGSPEIGDIKLDKSFIDCLIIKPKMYGGIECEGGEIIKIKGLPRKRNAADLCGVQNYNSLVQMAQEGSVYSDMFRFIKFKQGFKDGYYINMPEVLKKVMDCNDNKRSWDNAWQMHPEDSNPIQLSDNSYSNIYIPI